MTPPSVRSHSLGRPGDQDREFLDLMDDSGHFLTRNMIVLYADRRFVEGIPIEESRCARVTRTVTKCGLITLAYVGTIPYAPISLDFAGRNIIGYLMAYGNTTSFACLNAWSILHIVNTEFMPSSSEERILFEKRKHCGRRTVDAVFKISATILGFASQIPLGYLTYVYNGNHWGYPILTLPADSFFPIYSLALTFDGLFKKIGMTSFEKKLQLVKEFLSQRLQDMIKDLISLPKIERDQFLERLGGIKDLDETSRERVSLLFTLLFSRLVEQEVGTELCIRTTGRWAFGGMGVVLTFARLAIIAITAYKAIELFTNDILVCGSSAVLITACNAWLTYDVIVKSSTRSYDTVISFFQGKNQPSFSSVFYPKLSVATKLLTVGTAALSWGPSYEVPHDNTTGSFRTFMEIAVPLSSIVVVGNAMNDLANVIIEFYASHRGTSEEKQYLELKEKIDRFSLLIQRSPFDSFARCISLMPDNILQECYEQGNFTGTELRSYLASLETETSPLLSNSINLSIDEDGE